MHLALIVPGVRSQQIAPPVVCPYRDCEGSHFRLHQRVRKHLNDTVYPEVTAYRYQCLTCGRTFRAYPEGVSSAQTSLRVKRLAVILYLLGLSYAGASAALEALGAYVSKSQVFNAVQEVRRRAPGLRRRAILREVRSPVQDGDLASAESNGESLSLRLMTDDTELTVLTLAGFPRENAEMLKMWIAPIAEAAGARLLISDDVAMVERAAHPLDTPHRVQSRHLKPSLETPTEEFEEKTKKELQMPLHGSSGR